MLKYKKLDVSDIVSLNCIDRSDNWDTWCIVKDGKITQQSREFNHPGFSDSQWKQILAEFSVNVRNNDQLLFGAFNDLTLVGLSGLEIAKQYGIEHNMFNFGPMWISKAYRRRGIGKKLLNMAIQEAKKRDISALYVSATPVPGTVEFYVNAGCRLINVPDPDLFALEPEDIHLVLQL